MVENKKNYKLWNMLDSKDSNLTELAILLDVSYNSVLNKLNRKTEFTAAELKKIMERYNLTSEEVVEIFL